MDTVFFITEAKSHLKKVLNKKWQRQWDIQDQGRESYDIMPKVPSAKVKDTTPNIPRSIEVKFNRLRSGTYLLKPHKMRNNIDRRASLPVDRLCQCGEVQDLEHYLLSCALLDKPRKDMLNKIEGRSLQHGVRIDNVGISRLLGSNQDLPTKTRICVINAVCAYISKTASTDLHFETHD